MTIVTPLTGPARGLKGSAHQAKERVRALGEMEMRTRHTDLVIGRKPVSVTLRATVFA